MLTIVGGSFFLKSRYPDLYGEIKDTFHLFEEHVQYSQAFKSSAYPGKLLDLFDFSEDSAA